MAVTANGGPGYDYHCISQRLLPPQSNSWQKPSVKYHAQEELGPEVAVAKNRIKVKDCNVFYTNYLLWVDSEKVGQEWSQGRESGPVIV